VFSLSSVDMLLLRLAPIVFVIAFHLNRGKSIVTGRYEKFESCTTSGKSMKIFQCEINKEHKMFFNATFLKAVDDLIVS
jgi:hypothetical protein